MANKIIFQILFLIFLFPIVVAAAVIRVPLDYISIQQALDVANFGDTVQVSLGTYYESASLKRGVILEGGWNQDFSRRDPAAFVTTLDRENKGGWVVFGADEAVLDGFTIINGSLVDNAGSTSGAGIHCKSSSPTIKNNIIINNQPAGIYCTNSSAIIINNTIAANEKAGIYVEKDSFLIIEGNIIRDNNMSGIGSGDLPVSKIEVLNNIITNNQIAGINALTAYGNFYNNIIAKNKRAGIRYALSPVKIINNTIVANTRAGIIEVDLAEEPVIKNNIISHNGKSGIKAPSKGYTYNLLYANNLEAKSYAGYIWSVRQQFSGYEDEYSYKRGNNIIADPLFADANQDDYHLLPGSPAIDAGDSEPTFNDLYFPSSKGSVRNDIGAYGGEFAAKEQRGLNSAPIAEVNPILQSYVEDEVQLNASSSIDPDGDLLSWHWQLMSKPLASKADISEPNAVITSFKADLPGEYVVELIVKDRWGRDGEPETVTVSVEANRPPIGKIGKIHKAVNLGDQVVLPIYDASDPDGDDLSYIWWLVSKPDGSDTVLADANTENPSFTADRLGCYTVVFIVNDGKKDSDPDIAHICTSTSREGGIRNVPADYPTIQTAIDSAKDGDKVIVQNGVYHENLIIDKPVDLIGVDWPVIDGGTHQEQGEAILIFYLGNDAGSVEGFVITGGGTAPLGHGVKIWNSSPEIFNNRIYKNGYVGIGVHGKKRLTENTRIHDNLIYDNVVGVGNGIGCKGHIYNNTVYNNKTAGIGAKGLSSPNISGNIIYGNYVSIGTRGVAFPTIAGNRLYDNVFGISISPIRTNKQSYNEEIKITGNSIYNNDQGGIFISSFNLNEVSITDNLISSNNHQSASLEKGGGIVLGYPHQPITDIFIGNNTFENNKVSRIKKYTHPEQFLDSID